jgi:hypothetical protein
MSTNQTYTRELRDNLNYTATWLPNLKLSLGDVGVLSKYEFTYRTNLENLGIPFKEGKAGSVATYSYVSSDSVKRDIKLAGKAPIAGSVLADVDAGITFTFSREDAVVFLATGCTVRTIANQEPIKKAIQKAYDHGAWERDYVVVTELVSAASTTIIISEGSAGQFELQAKAGVNPTFEAINTEGNFSLVHEAHIGFNCLAAAGITPLFRCLGVRIGWFREDVVTRDRLVSREAPKAGATHVTVDEVEYDDYPDTGKS